MALLSPEILQELREVERDPNVTFSATGFCVRSTGGSSYYVKTGSSIQEEEQYQGA